MDVLIIEDDEVLGKALRRGLEESGHRCTWVKNGEKGLASALSQKCDTIVLDLMLPDRSGLDVLQSLRAQGVRTPVMILTALGSVDERVDGLNAGADDYLVKPFSFSELIARLCAISRRSINLNTQQLIVGPLKLDLSLRRVTRDGVEIDLTPTEFSLLELLDAQRGPGADPQDAVRAPVGLVLGRRHERHRSAYHSPAGEDRPRL